MIDKVYVLLLITMTGVFFIVSILILLQAKSQNRILLQKKELAEKEIAHQQELTRVLIASQEQERKRIGMDMHDEVGTVLAALRMSIEKINEATPEQIPTLINRSKQSIDNVINSVRRISHNLSPIIKGINGLRSCIEDIVDNVNRSGSIKMTVNYDDEIIWTLLTEDMQLAIYRIVTELINNTLKHAQARYITLNFHYTTDAVIIKYKDDGVGLPAEGIGIKGMGVSNIRSRCNAMNATYMLDASEIKGYAVNIMIPV